MFKSSSIVFGLMVFLVGPVHATLIDQPGKIYSSDNTQDLLWLDIAQTTAISYNQMIAGAGGLLANGWRHATSPEVAALYSSNLSTLITSTSTNSEAQPGDYFADFQTDLAGEGAALINTLGNTISSGSDLQGTIATYNSLTTTSGHRRGAVLNVIEPTNPNFGNTLAGQSFVIEDDVVMQDGGHFLVRSASSIPAPQDINATLRWGFNFVGDTISGSGELSFSDYHAGAIPSLNLSGVAWGTQFEVLDIDDPSLSTVSGTWLIDTVSSDLLDSIIRIQFQTNRRQLINLTFTSPTNASVFCTSLGVSNVCGGNYSDFRRNNILSFTPTAIPIPSSLTFLLTALVGLRIFRSKTFY